MGQKAAQTIYYSFEQAGRIGRPLNQWITINFALTNIEPWQAPLAFQKLRDKFSKWVARPRAVFGNASAPTYLYVFENATKVQVFTTMNPGEPHNVHVHWLVHIPEGRFRDFEQNLWAWLEEVGNGLKEGKPIDIKPPHTLGLRGYLLKGTIPTWASVYGSRPEPQGIILGGRRSNTSQNLGPTARRKADKLRGIRRRIPARTRFHTHGALAMGS